MQKNTNFRYEIFVAPWETYISTTSPIIRWAKETQIEEHLLVLRVMDTSCYKSKCTGSAKAMSNAAAHNKTHLSASASKVALGVLYPTVDYLTLEEATSVL